MKKRIFAFLMSALMIFTTLAVTCSAAEGVAFDINSDVLDPIKTALTENISITNIIAVIVAGITVSLGFVLMWFGFRKVRGMIMAAAKKGKLGG